MSPRHLHSRGRPNSFALILTLALVVIVSIMLVAFVTVTRSDRTATSRYGQSIRAEQLALGGLNRVVADLQSELGRNQAPDTSAGLYPDKPIYTDVTSTNIRPQIVGGNSAIPNLVKTSTTLPGFTGARYSSLLVASGVNSATPSLNERSVSKARWEQAKFGVFPTSAETPNWVIVTRGGVTNGASLPFGAAPGSINNADPVNANYALGRIAYAVYDEGGLLDVTAAGCPGGLTADQIGQIKGSLAGATLGTPVSVNAASLVAWRNPASGATAAGYVDFARTNDFSKVFPGDAAFLSRQDLIKAASQAKAGMTANSPTNLTTFTREKNAPTWSPSKPNGSTIDYAAQANLPTATNRAVLPVRLTRAGTITSYGVDGAPYTYGVQAGDSLLQRRFPLDRLAWLGPTGPRNGGTDANIQAAFGLLWDGSTGIWKYVGPTGSTERGGIETLEQIAQEATPREANFFELLQAGILSGSTGVAGNPDVLPTTSHEYHQFSTTLQVLRIGACIIDQYDDDSYPTIIEYQQSGGPWQAAGVESLPYVNICKTLDGESADIPASATPAKGLAWYLLFGLWNPHQGPVPVARPKVRLHIVGSIAIGNNWSTQAFRSYFSYSVRGVSIGPIDDVIELNSGAGGVDGFAAPGLVMPSDVSAVLNDGSPTIPGWVKTPATLPVSSVGYRLPDYKIENPPAANPPPAMWDTSANYPNWNRTYLAFSSSTTNPFQYYMEYQNPLGQWIPYNFAAGINDPLTWVPFAGTYNEATVKTPLVNTLPTLSPLAYTFDRTPMRITSDPRSLRFGTTRFDRNNVAAHALLGPLWDPAATTSPDFFTYGYGGGRPQAGTVPHGPLPYEANVIPSIFGDLFHPATLARNNKPNGFSFSAIAGYSAYSDNDGIQRLADSGAFTSAATPASIAVGNPYQRVADKPVILNRRFRSVAELGFAFRDDPWRSLDLFSAGSPDAGLLDLFTVRQDTRPVVTGRLDLNTQNAAALAAMLRDIVVDPVAGTAISNAQADAIAAAVVNSTGAAPICNKSELVSRFGPALNAGALTDPWSGVITDTDARNIKARREASVRALSDVGQTRTWNLMIDLVAQVGKYPPAATRLDQFVVEGERRCWLHVAIDRFTGEILDQQLEPVLD